MASKLFDLTGKIALITGASQGIGFATACELGQMGATVIVTSHDQEGCERAVHALYGLGIEASFLIGDLRIDDEIAAVARKANSLRGRIDILVSSAGINAPFGPILDVADADYDLIMQVNLRAGLQLCKAIVPGMAERRSGAVVLMSSLSGLRGNRAIGAYALSKAALAQLARNLAVEYGPFNVRVNAVSPGLIATPFSQSMMEDPEHLAARLQKTPLRRIGEAHEVAGAVAFLASDAGAFVTGHNLVVDGGTLITD